MEKFVSMFLFVAQVVMEFTATGAVLFLVIATASSLTYKPTKLKALAHVGAFLLVEALVLAVTKNYLFATFLLFIYVGAVVVLFTVVLLLNKELELGTVDNELEVDTAITCSGMLFLVEICVGRLNTKQHNQAGGLSSPYVSFQNENGLEELAANLSNT